MWYLSFSDWLISLSIISSMSIHAVANGKILFFFMAIHYLFFIFSSPLSSPPSILSLLPLSSPLRLLKLSDLRGSLGVTGKGGGREQNGKGKSRVAPIAPSTADQEDLQRACNHLPPGSMQVRGQKLSGGASDLRVTECDTSPSACSHSHPFYR